MIKIYRVQNEIGLGPYQYIDDDGNNIEWKKSHCQRNGQPTPSQDGINKLNRGKYLGPVFGQFAFESIEQLKKWFSEYDRKEYRKYGFEEYEIEVKEIEFKMYSQVTYNPDHVISEKPISIGE